MATPADLARRVDGVRRFNRFYTGRIGVLQERLVNSSLSLTEARVIYELAHRERPTAAELGRDLGLDAGYLSRILRDFKARRLVERRPSKADGRESLLALRSRGRRAFGVINSRTREQVRAMLAALSELEQRRLVAAMHTIERLLGASPEPRVPVLFRSHEPGDLGWVVHRHGVLYAQEEGYDYEFEALVAEIVAGFVRTFDPARERCWIAEKEGVNVGSVFLVKASPTVAKLRLLLVEPEARGAGIGARLIGECTRFARHAGYRKIVLWTQQTLRAARRLYEREGYYRTREEPHHSFGQDLVGETWELTL